MPPLKQSLLTHARAAARKFCLFLLCAALSFQLIAHPLLRRRYYSLDLSTGLFQALGNLDQGLRESGSSATRLSAEGTDSMSSCRWQSPSRGTGTRCAASAGPSQFKIPQEEGQAPELSFAVCPSVLAALRSDCFMLFCAHAVSGCAVPLQPLCLPCLVCRKADPVMQCILRNSMCLRLCSGAVQKSSLRFP